MIYDNESWNGRGNVMSEQLKDSGPIYEMKKKPDGHKKRKSSDPLPGVNIRELVEERNWTALAGLALIGLGLVYIVMDVLNISFALWAWMLLAAGAWLTFDAWQKYDAAGRQWVGNTRNRMMAGAVIALIGLMGAMHINWWGVLLLGTGGWLGYDTWQKVESAGRVWTQRTRNRMFAAGALALIGFFSLIPSWSIWPLLIIVIGAVMLYRHIGGRTCC
jgi:hypothetical protein